ncbi:MAG: catabolite control protein A [Oscillospiraceae bacterium]|jgi:hypothetical protein|nr:catabolite control protein A [Oscillospiraceae bacterium]
MKKILLLLLAFCFSVSLVACGNDTGIENLTKSQQQTENSSVETTLPSDGVEQSNDKSEQSNEELGAFNKNASLAETVLVDEGGVKITATGLNYTNYSVELELAIENSSGKDLSFISGSMGYSCNSINGYMVSGGYLNCDVADGKKANDSIGFDYDELMLFGINEISDMEIGFDMSDKDYNHTYSGPRQVKTSAFDAHDYSKDYYQETIASRAAMDTYHYDITHFSQDALYDVNGVKLLSSGVMINRDGETALLLELENTTSDMVYVSTSDIAINGLVVSNSIWSTDAINPGKHGIINVELSSVFNSEYWDIYGIKDVGSVTLSLSQRDSEGNDITDKSSVEVVVPDVKAEYDATGKEVYNNGGLRIVAKTLLEDPSEYSSDVYVLLLAENKSGKTLSIDDVYNSLFVNNFMTSYFYSGRELADGECAALEIELRGNSLEENKIASASEIKEIEVKFEIKEGRTTIDEPTVKISFE